MLQQPRQRTVRKSKIKAAPWVLSLACVRNMASLSIVGAVGGALSNRAHLTSTDRKNSAAMWCTRRQLPSALMELQEGPWVRMEHESGRGVR